MSVKDDVAGLLYSCGGDYISGEEIAKKLLVTRAAVWKAVASLKSDGYEIDAVTNKGYTLLSSPGTLSAAGIKRFLTGDAEKCIVNVYDTVTSTNAVARECAASGAAEGSVFVSREQTKGRGRMGRNFYSPNGTGVYISVLLRPRFEPEAAPLITTAAAVSAAKTLKKLGANDVGIKWVNDIFCGGKKVCGILTEASLGLESGCLDYAVLGAGVNLFEPDGGFPKELEGIAGAVFKEKAPDALNRFTAYFLNNFFEYYSDLKSRPHIAEYKKLCFIPGKEIAVISGESRKEAKAVCIGDDCRLLVKYNDGSEEWLSAGEISVRIKS